MLCEANQLVSRQFLSGTLFKFCLHIRVFYLSSWNLFHIGCRSIILHCYNENEMFRVDIEKMCSELRAQLEATKYDIIKYCIGTLVSKFAIGLAILRILM